MTLDKLITHMCLCHQAVSFGTGQREVTVCGWEYIRSYTAGFMIVTRSNLRADCLEIGSASAERAYRVCMEVPLTFYATEGTPKMSYRISLQRHCEFIENFTIHVVHDTLYSTASTINFYAAKFERSCIVQL